MSGMLEEIIARLTKIPEVDRSRIIEDGLTATKHLVWVPNPGPQTMAKHTPVDELFYGGQAGGGKSDLACGMAITEHEYSIIFRRFNDDAKALAERTKNILRDASVEFSYNGQDQVIRTETANTDGVYARRSIEFAGLKDLEDRQRHKGRPHDLLAFDEIGDFLEAQYTFIIGWNRSANAAQRCRVVCTGNPPTTADGLWVIKRWAAWLDPTHHHPAADGELRWYTTGADGREVEVDGAGPHMIQGEAVMARSRTFIRARLADNPDLTRTNYDAVLAALPAELREAYREGRFDAGLKDKPFQLIPTAWVRAAQEHWTERPPIGVPMCALAVDCTGGGVDPMVIGARHDGWFAPLVVIPGHEIPAAMAGQMSAGHVIAHRRDNALMIVDMGGGYGGPLYEHLKANFDTDATREPRVKAYKGSEGSVVRTVDGQLGFANVRTQALWRFREALDPGQVGGSPIMLPPDAELLSDLTSPSYEVRNGVIHAEAKKKVCERIGRSTNKGDTVCMCWTAGPIASTDGAIWDQLRHEMGTGGRLGGRRPQAILSRQPLTGRRR